MFYFNFHWTDITFGNLNLKQNCRKLIGMPCWFIRHSPVEILGALIYEDGLEVSDLKETQFFYYLFIFFYILED